MPVRPTYPGVYIEELPSGVRTITGVSTSIAAFIGFFTKGPLISNGGTAPQPAARPLRVFSFAEFEREFGGLDVRSEASYAIQQFFRNGGGEAWIIRVAGSAGGVPTRASVDIHDKANTVFMTLSARSEGAWGNTLRARVDRATEQPGRFNMTVMLYSGTGPGATPVLEEQFLDLSGDPDDTRFFEAVVLEESTLITAKRGAAAGPGKLPAPNGTCGEHIASVAVPAADKNTLDIRLLSGEDLNSSDWISVPVEMTDPADDLVKILALRGTLEQALRAAGVANDRPSLAGAAVEFVHGHMVVSLDSSARDYRSDAVLDIAGKADDEHISRLLGFEGAGISENVHEYTLGQATPEFDPSSDPPAVQVRQGLTVEGADGATPDADALKRGLAALKGVELFNVLSIPCAPTLADTAMQQVYSEAIDLCEKKRAFLLIDLPPKVNKYTEVKDWLEANPGFRSKNAAVYFPRIRIPDPKREYRLRTVGASGTMAGLYARTDRERGVWKAPAGIEANLRGVSELETELTDPENGVLNPLGINVLRNFRVAGNVAWGSRTLRGADQLADDWKYVPVRRLALFIEESLYRGTQWVVFEPNDEPLWAQIRLNVGAFMHDLFRQGAFQGQKPRDAYLVKCDKETTTQNDINKGVVNVLVGFAPLKPAEFVIIQIQQLAGQIQA